MDGSGRTAAGRRPGERVGATVGIETLVYGTAGEEGRPLTMFLLRPQPALEGGPEGQQSGPRPAIVGVHGGAFRAGSKDAYVLRLLPFARRGYVCASVEYRLSGEAAWPAQIEDCKCAVRFLRAHAEALGIDPQRIGAWGSSAGGHLVTMLGTTAGVQALEGSGGWAEHSSRVQAVCDWFGPVDLVRMLEQPSTLDHGDAASPESGLLGGPIKERLDLAREASPVTYVSGDEPPFLILHGTEDPLIPHQQSLQLYEALTATEVTFVSLPGAGHGGPEFEHPHTRRLLHAFFDRHLRPASGDGGAEALGPEALGVAQPALDPGRAPERREVSSRSWDNPGFVPPLTEYRTFPSVAAGGAVGYAVYLPPGFSAAEGANGVPRRYPVVYWLHGMGGGPWRGARFVERFDQAIREGLIPPAIAVLPTGGPRSMYADARDGSWPVETVLVRELIPHVDATYPTLAEPGARAAGGGRIIEGQSMGGWGAARLGFGYPELFGAVSISAGALIRTPSGAARSSPTLPGSVAALPQPGRRPRAGSTPAGAPRSLDRERQSPRFQAVWGGDAAAFEEADPRTIVRRNAARIKALGQRVRIFVGGEDRLLEANRTFHTLLDELGIAHEYVEVPGAGHGYDDKVDRLGLPFFAWFGGAPSVPPESSPESSPAMR